MASLSYDELSQLILSLDLLDLGKLRDVENSFGARVFSSEEFLRELLKRGYVTKYQVERLGNGDTTGYYYGPYRIQYLAGAGSFARVFRCVNKDTGQVVAVKVLRARFRDDETAVTEFQREGELGMQMRHPNIPAVYEYGQTEYDYYIVMEFVEGRTLREELNAQRNGRLEPRRATRIVYDVCSALDYALKRGYQHRDMKLSNILLSTSGKAMLLDFGLLTDDISGFKTQRAIEYAALERATRVGRDDKRSDLYFLGSVYYQLLTGIAPLGETKDRSKRLDAGRFRHVRPIREVAPYVPRCVAYVVDRAMKFDPTERYQDPGFMLDALDAAVETLESGVDLEEEERLMTAALQDPAKKEQQTAVMVVEANTNLQDAFRESFTNAGFRTLVVSNCERALERLDDGEAFSVDVALFNAQSLGPEAVKTFNKLLELHSTKNLPAILLLDEKQVKWAASARRGKKRLAVGMPITMRRLIMVVKKLVAQEAAKEEAKRKAVAPKEEKQEKPETPERREKPATRSAVTVEDDLDDLPMEAFDDALEDAYQRFYVRKEKLSDFRNQKADPGKLEETRVRKEGSEPGSDEGGEGFVDPDVDSDYLDPGVDHD
ncbi:MAG: protein kinase domain-containing protein [Thermoguttaceae bacterium]|jgi:serine/threonine protein kinase